MNEKRDELLNILDNLGLESKAIGKLEESKTTKEGMLDLLTFAAVPFSFPLALGIIVYNTYSASKDKLDKPMPDEWVDKIANDSTVSNKGLKFLATKLSDKGFISIGDSKEWIDLEMKIAKNRLESLEKEKSLKEKGAINLLNRVKKIPNIESVISLDSAFDKVKSTIENTGKFVDVLHKTSKFFNKK